MDTPIRPQHHGSRQPAAGSSAGAAIAGPTGGHARAAVSWPAARRRVPAASAALAVVVVAALCVAPEALAQGELGREMPEAIVLVARPAVGATPDSSGHFAHREALLAEVIGGRASPEPSEGALVSELVSSPHPVPGVTARVLPGHAPGILLDAASTRRTITVLGPTGEPYLRLGPRGVEVNMRSPADPGTGPENGAQAPASGDVRAAPRWRRIASEARYAWLESRARFPPELVPADVVTGGRPRVLLTWEIPLEVDGRRTQLRGVTSWVPSAASAEWGGAGRLLGAFGVPIAALGALTVVAVAALIAVARRRAR